MPPSSSLLTASAVSMDSPQFHATFAVGEDVTFSGTCDANVGSVDLMADGLHPMGPAKIGSDGRSWVLRRPFSSSGLRRIEATAFDSAGNVMGMDSVELIVQPPPVSAVRKKMASIAISQLGLKESGKNTGSEILKFQDYCGFPNQGVEWCFCFVNWVFHEASGQNPDWGRTLARVPNGVAWAKKNSRWIRENDPHVDNFSKGDPKPGDLIVMGDFVDFSIRDNYPHIEMVVQVTSTTIHTVGGNVSDRVSRAQHTRVGNDPGGRYIAGYIRAFLD